jgi:endo-1,4-beta-xylanase
MRKIGALAALSLVFVVSLPAQTTLREAAGHRLLVGAAADADEHGRPNRLLDAAYAEALASQFNMLEAENAMKWDAIEPAPDHFDFSAGDKLVAFAVAHQMKVRGHNLCWHEQIPAWLTALAKTATPAQIAAIFERHIDAEAGHYRGQVFAWDVVNEAFADPHGSGESPLRDSIWSNRPGIGATGTGYIERAFRLAHAADPDAKLFYNDYEIGAPGPKFSAVLAMAKDFVARGVPLHGIGFQTHLTLGRHPTAAELAQNMKEVAALGLQIHITEMDVRIPVDASGNASAADLAAQAEVYRRVLGVCLAQPACTAFQVWGVSDGHSWIPHTYHGFGAALLLDARYRPKPAFDAVIEALRKAPPVP